jgi:hypothetical protein
MIYFQIGNDLDEQNLKIHLNGSKNDILIITSSEGLLNFEMKIDLVKKWCKSGVTVKIMAPITRENLNFTHVLLEFCEIRHIPAVYREITIVDSQLFFQFNNPSLTNIEEANNFQNVFFTNYCARGKLNKT